MCFVCTTPSVCKRPQKSASHCAFCHSRRSKCHVRTTCVLLSQPVSARSMQKWGTALPCAWCFNSIGSLQHTSRGIIKFKRFRLDKCWLQAQHDRKQRFSGLCKAGAVSHVQRTAYRAEVWVDAKALKPAKKLPLNKYTIRCPHWR